MITISLCMIVKNEEATLERCLKSIESFTDEIVIVDTGSNDRTKEIAGMFTDKVYDFEWNHNFSAARNFSYEKATMEYIMWLDADDIILPADAEKIIELKANLTPDIDGVMMKYNTGFDAQGRVTFSFYRERLSKRSPKITWKEPVHEYLDIQGKKISTDICVTHAKPDGRHTNRNIEIYESNILKGTTLSPRGMFYYARELKDHGRMAEAATWFGRFLDSGAGWVEDNITACGDLARCYTDLKMWNEALASLTRSFSYDTPRAEICCQIGYHFKNLGKYNQAAFWFQLILSLDGKKVSWGFRQEDCWGFIPCIELAVCHDKLGNYEKAEMFNLMAAKYKPDSPAVLYNMKYFENRRRVEGVQVS